MTELRRAARCIGLLLAITFLPAGCSPFRPAPKEVEPLPLETPAEVKPMQKTPLRQPVAAKQPALPPKPKHLVHTVRTRGETLSAIAAWYTGSGHNWQRLVAANPDLDPRRIRIGAHIIVPETILITREPMPKMIQRETKQSRQMQPPIEQLEPVEVELFGPIETSPQDVTDSGLPYQLQSLD